MDVKVKQMIKLIEEDADSFARRAEMYYKKRPELMKMVEEFYRAYRALAERYDHATGVIRQAQKTMTEAFPNQVPFMLADDSPSGFADGEPRTPDMPPMRALFDPDELQKDALGVSPSHFNAIKRNGAFTEESDSVPGKKGLKQFNGLFGSAEGPNSAKLVEGRARKGLNFHDAEVPSVQSSDIKARVPSESERVSKAEMEISTLKNTLAKLEAEKEAELLQYQQSLERLSNLESEVSRAKEDSVGLNERASKAESEVQTLKEAITRLEAERESSFLQYQQCLDKITILENSVSCAHKDAGELTERASKAEIEAETLKKELNRLEAEKENALHQYNQCLEKISALEEKLFLSEEDARRFNERADKAESEVEFLRQEVSKLTKENEDAAVKFQQCMDTISGLERKLASLQEEAQRLNSEIDDGVAKLKGAEEKCLLLEKSNHTMHSEVETLVQKMAAQNEELTEKQKELGRLWTCLQEERLRFMEAETAFQTLQHLHSQSQEELRSMAAEIQNKGQILQGLEVHNQSLQNEVEEVKVKNKGLSDVNLSSTLTIESLQDEISSLRETIGKLEADVELRLDQRNALQQEIYCLKEELQDLKKNHQAIIEQVESVGLSPDCLGSSVQDLQDENIRLKEVCEQERSKKVALLEKLEIMEKLIEKNALLENSLSDLNVELEGVRERVRELEESCQSLLGEKSTLVSEKAALVSELQVATDNLEKLAEKNNLLENSLSDANAEVEGLRVKSKNLEDLAVLLENEKLDLVTMKRNLISQLDITQKTLENLEKNYTDLERRYSSLDKERESKLQEVEELQVHLDAQKQKHSNFAQVSEAQLAGMATQIQLLQEESQRRIKKQYEEELEKAFFSQTEIFILQKCVQDQEGNNVSLLLECQKLLEASKLSEKLISKLEHENLEQQMEVKSLYDQIKVLRVGLYRVLKTLELEVNPCGEDKADHDQILLNHALNKLQQTQRYLLEMQDKYEKSVIENSVFVTLLGQLQHEVANLVTAKNTLDQELTHRSEQFLVLHSESKNLLEMNEGLKNKIVDGEHREDLLNIELKNVHGQLLDLQVAYQNLQEENCKLLDEQRSFMKSISNLGEEKRNLEDENCTIFSETVSLSTLSLIFRDIISEKVLEVIQLNQNLDKLYHVNNGLDEKVKTMEGKLVELSLMFDEKRELHKMVEDLKSKCDEAELIRADQEKQIIKLSGDYDQQSMELECIREANRELEADLEKLNGEILEAKSREESLNSELQKERYEVQRWESQAAVLFGELQISTVQQALFEGKVYELIEACESLEGKSVEIDQLKERVTTLECENEELKTTMTSYIPTFISLRESIMSLENHTSTHAILPEVDKKEPKGTMSEVHLESSQETNYEQRTMNPDELLDLQNLEMRIKAIEEAVLERERLAVLEQSSANSKLEAAMGEIEVLKSRSSLHQVSIGVAKHGSQNPEGKGLRHETNGAGNEVMTKDIMLDQVSECSSYGISRRDTVKADDQMLEIWETANHDTSIDLTVEKSVKANAALAEKKRSKRYSSTESMVEKDVSVDKLEISRRFSGSRQEGNERKVLERLDSDAQKLTNLQITVQDLKKKVEITEKSKKDKGLEYDSVKEQLEESEETIMKLFDQNRKLTKSVEDDASTFDENSILDENGIVRKRKIAEQARRDSQKIGRLQLEVQKIQFLLVKRDDENKSRGKTKIMDRRTSVLLRDYLYGGTRTTPRRKKGNFCACVKPPTKGD